MPRWRSLTSQSADMHLVLQVFFAVAFSAIGIANAQMAFPDITKASGAVKRVFSVIDRMPAILPNTASGQLDQNTIRASSLETQTRSNDYGKRSFWMCFAPCTFWPYAQYRTVQDSTPVALVVITCRCDYYYISVQHHISISVDILQERRRVCPLLQSSYCFKA